MTQPPEPDDASLSLDQIRTDVADVLYEQPADIADEENLLDRGLDSIRLMTLVERWRLAGVDTNFLELADDPTVKSWWDLLGPRAEPAV